MKHKVVGHLDNKEVSLAIAAVGDHTLQRVTLFSRLAKHAMCVATQEDGKYSNLVGRGWGV